MKLRNWIACLLLPSPVFAYTPQEISKLINQKLTNPPPHHLYQHKQNNHFLNWEALQGPQVSGVLKITAMKNKNNILFAYNQNLQGAIYKSIDGGQHWKILTSPMNHAINDLISLDENRLLLAEGNHIYSSSDQGEHWIVNTTIDDSCNHLFALRPDLILLATNEMHDFPGIYRSIDGGKTWTPARLGLEGDSWFFNLGGRDNILLVSDSGLSISTNEGLLWSRPSKHWEKIVWSFAVNSRHDIFAASSSLYKTDVTGQVWEKINNNIVGDIETVKVDPQDNLFAISKNEKNNYLYRSKDNGKTWELCYQSHYIYDLELLDNGKVLLSTDKGLIESDTAQVHYEKLGDIPYSFSQTRKILAFDENHFLAIDGRYSGGLYKRNDAGKTWTLLKSNNVNDAVRFNDQLVTLEYNGKNEQLFMSSDLGQTWQPGFQSAQGWCSLAAQNKGLLINCENESYFTHDLTNWNAIKTEGQLDRVRTYFSGNSIYLTNANSIKRSNDEGKTWVTLLDNLYQYRAYIAGYKDDILLIAFNNAGIVKMTNGGKTWDMINNGLTDFDFTDLLVLDQNHYLVSTDQGIFFTEDGGQQWQSVNQGLDNRDILSLSAYQKIILAGTNGSGVFKTVIN